MPRRNHRRQGHVDRPTPWEKEREPTFDQLAKSLVDRGLASPLILGPRPRPRTETTTAGASTPPASSATWARQTGIDGGERVISDEARAQIRQRPAARPSGPTVPGGAGGTTTLTTTSKENR